MKRARRSTSMRHIAKAIKAARKRNATRRKPDRKKNERTLYVFPNAPSWPNET